MLRTVSVVDCLRKIEVGLEDLQSGLEAGSREATLVHDHAERVDQFFSQQVRSTQLLDDLIQRTQRLRACLKDQRAVLKQLRANMSDLREDCTCLNSAESAEHPHLNRFHPRVLASTLHGSLR